MSKRGGRRGGALVPSPQYLSGPVHFRVVQQVGGQALAEIGIDYSRADIPDRSYYADHVDVQRARSGISLLFGKLMPGASRLRTQVEVVFPDDMFVRQLWRSSREMHKSLEENRGKLGTIQEISEVEGTDKVQTFRSNNVFLGQWGDEAVADFYYISPRDFYYAKEGLRTVSLEPVVRIAMHPGLILELLDKCRGFASTLESSIEEVTQI